MKHFSSPLGRWVLCACLLLGQPAVWAQVSVITLNTAYNQDFNTLAATGTGTAVPAGWTFLETGTNANATYTAGTGSGNAGDTYSYGPAGGADRALGGLRSGSVTTAVGGSFVNNTGGEITSLTLAYTGEQWRLGAATRAVADRWDFQYSLTATALNTGTWTDANDLDFTAPVTAGTVGLLDGNAAANRRTLTATLTGLSIPAGGTFWIRWNDTDVAGSDDGLAIDDFSLTANGTVTVPVPVLTVSAATLAFGELAAGGTAVRSFTVNGTDLSADGRAVVSGAGFSLSKDNISFSTELTFTPAELASPASIHVRFAPTAVGTATGSVRLTSPGTTGQTVALTGSAADPFTQAFSACAPANAANLPGGWTQASTAGVQTWACTTFGRTGNAVQVNGFSGTALQNTDWLISPALDLTDFTFPLLSFWSRTRFSGPSLRLLVSTDYVTGTPDAATWTELNGRFPLANSDVWTATENVNLAAFKQAGVRIAFVYDSSPAAGAARWTIDDFSVVNSATPPPPVLTTALTPLTDLHFELAGANQPSEVKAVPFSLANATAALTVQVPAPFLVSQDGVSFGTQTTFSIAELDTAGTLFVRALAATEGAFSGRITFSSAGVDATQGFLTAASVSRERTFDVVSMNVEWFGHPGNGPADNALQARNLRILMARLDADVFAFQEISDTALLGATVRQLPGYAYVVSPAVSNAATNDPLAQKLVFAYKTATVAPLAAKPLLTGVDLNALPGYPDPDPTRFWASGRLPFLLDADVTVNGVRRRVALVNIHARANSGDDLSRYRMRTYDVQVLKDTLDAYYAGVPVVLLGDYNDDVDEAVVGVPPLPTSYLPFVLDTDDYRVATRVLSDAGLRSYITEANVIDHITVTDELFAELLPAATRLVYPFSFITNYENTLSDHLPVLARFRFLSAPSVTLTAPAGSSSVLRGTDVVVSATATDADGTVARVDFYNGNMLLGTDASAPFSLTMPQIEAGTYAFTAIAYDDDQLADTSAVATLRVVEPGIQGADCAAPGNAYVYELFVDGPVRKITWLANGPAKLTEDPANPYRVTVTFKPESKQTVEVVALVHSAARPRLQRFERPVQVGDCGGGTAARRSAERLADAASLSASPNPTTGRVRLMLGDAPAAGLRLFDATGRECRFGRTELDGRTVEMNLGTLPAGLYLLRTADGRTLRLVRQ